jgi:hypothetical protein
MDRRADLAHAHRNVDGPAIERHQRQARQEPHLPRRATWASGSVKLCTVCGVVTSRSTGRCSEHPRLSGIGANHHIHADPRWTRLSQRVIDRHVGQHGWVCPGDGPEHPAHPSRDLTTDHVLALIEGGAPFDPANTRVLCRSRNSANGARRVNARRADRGYPHAGSALLDVRASHLYARGRVSREIPVAIAWAGPLDTGAAPARVPPRRAHGRVHAVSAPRRPR